MNPTCIMQAYVEPVQQPVMDLAIFTPIMQMGNSLVGWAQQKMKALNHCSRLNCGEMEI